MYLLLFMEINVALIRTVSASQAKEYYYDKDPIFAPKGKGENSEWFGKLKNLFPNLGDKVNADDFEALLFGLHPTTKERLVYNGVNNERRAGIDFAFSAPKSVSIMALHCGDERIVAAHQDAVRKALAFVQDNLIYYREKVNNELVHVKSDNIIAAQFTHSTSRANDPQLHTHAVVINMTETHDGKFKAISNEHIFKYQGLINNVYQNELACSIEKLGYKIENFENKFEIKGVPEEAIEIFSKRSKEVDEMAEQLKLKHPEKTDAEIYDMAVLKSRQSKDTDINAEQLRMLWEEEYSKKKINVLLNNNKHEIQTDIESDNNKDKDIIKNAVNQLHKTESTFTKFDLLNTLIKQNRGEKFLQEFQSEIDKSIKSKNTMVIGKKDTYDIMSTPEMIKCEIDILNETLNSVGTLSPFFNKGTQPDLSKYGLTQGQETFVNHVLTSEDKINIIQGDAGTGKTYAVKVLNEILSAAYPNTSIIGLGFTGKAAMELAEAASIKTSTIASFLLSEKKENENKNQNAIYIVDESSMVSSRDMLDVITKAGKNRIVLIGDGKQLQAIGAGKMFKELQQGNYFVKMEEVLRQTTPEMKKLVKTIKDYQENNGGVIEDAIKILDDDKRIHEVTSLSKTNEASSLYLREKAVEEYLQSNDCLLLTPSRAEKDILNKMVRDKIFKDKDNNGENKHQKIKIRESLNLSGYALSEYKIGDIISSKEGEGVITAIDKNKKELVILSKNEKTFSINPIKTEGTAYREKELELAEGDKIMFTKNNKELDVQNGLSGTVKSIDDKGNISILLKNKEVNFNAKDYSYLDYAYAQTVHKSQGQTSKESILVHNQNDKISTESFYVAATRAKEKFQVITTDKELLLNSIKKPQDKTSTLEYENSKNLLADFLKEKEAQNKKSESALSK